MLDPRREVAFFSICQSPNDYRGSVVQWTERLNWASVPEAGML